MLEDGQKLRFKNAAVKSPYIIASFNIDPEFQALIDLYGSSTKTLLNEAQVLEDVNAELQVAGNVFFLNRLDDNGNLFTSEASGQPHLLLIN
jgi:hypothetical protein